MTIRITKNDTGRYIATINDLHGSVHEDVTPQIDLLISSEAAKLAEELRTQHQHLEFEEMKKAIDGCLTALDPYIAEMVG